MDWEGADQEKTPCSKIDTYMGKPNAFWREIFTWDKDWVTCHNHKKFGGLKVHQTKSEALHGGGSITGVLHKVNEMMKKEDYLKILQSFLKSKASVESGI